MNDTRNQRPTAEQVFRIGRWGAEDERGALNLMVEDTVLAALGEASVGKVYPLGIPIQRSGVPSVHYRGPAQRLTLLNHTDKAMWDAVGVEPDCGFHEDILIIPSHAPTHIDALCHVFKDGQIYNGFPHNEMESFSGAQRCGIENAGPIVARGVLIDVARHKNTQWLPADYVITADDLASTLREDGLELRSGDVALIRTGWLEWFFEQGEMTLEQPGIDIGASRLLAEADVLAVGSDNTAVEALPGQGILSVHGELLVNRGIYLIEHVHLAELAKDRRLKFLFVASPLPITGATGSPVCPFAVT